MAAVTQLSDVHPLLRHPRPIPGDFAKAQRMLGLISDDVEEKQTTLRRERSKTTKWLERPLYAHLDVSDVESEKEECYGKQKDYEKTLDTLSNRARSERSSTLSSEDSTHITVDPKTDLDSRRRPEPLRSVSYNSQHLLSPEWTSSPATMSPATQCPRPTSLQHGDIPQQRSSFSSTSSTGSHPRSVHPHSWPVPTLQHSGRTDRPASYQPLSSASNQDDFWSLGSTQLTERRPRPVSSATYQHRDRRSSKIASSRGLRNNSYPNFSRPISDAPPKVVPGESLESDAVCGRISGIEDGLPLPASSASDNLLSVDGNTREEKKPKHRWSALPSSFKKFTMRRLSGSAQDQKTQNNTNDLQRVGSSEHKLRVTVEHSPIPMPPRYTPSGGALLPTPNQSPLNLKHPIMDTTLPLPFAPWADAPPSPALSHEQRSDSESSLSAARKRLSSCLSIDNLLPSRPISMHSRNSSLGMPSPSPLASTTHVPIHTPVSPRPGSSRRGTPSLERTCIVCRVTQEPTAFINRRIAANCWHESSTCYGCLQKHIELCVVTKGWEHCTCPECGERLTYEDMGAFADDDTFVRWDD